MITKRILVILSILSLVVVSPLMIWSPAGALDIYKDACSGPAGSQSQLCKDKTNSSLNGLVKVVVDFLMWLAVIISVIVIILSGIKYATSGGEAQKISSAKNTLLGAVIGVAVAILAHAMVSFILKQFKIIK